MAHFLLAAILVWAIDRTGKSLAWRRVGPGGAWIRGPLAIRPTRHERVARRGRGRLTVAWLLALAAALVLLASETRAASLPLALGLGAAVGGGGANLWDLRRHGAVLDFLDLGLGVFNPADVGIVAGLAAALVGLALTTGVG